MDNVSNALKIAGGMLITVLLLGVIVFVYRSVSTRPQLEEEKLAIEERTAFNMEYESYEKKIMLGTDLITVINKAIDNNKKYNYSDSQEKGYYINIKFKLKNPVEKVVYLYSVDEDGKQKSKRVESECQTIFAKTGRYIYLFDASSGRMNPELASFMKLSSEYSNSSNKEAIEEKLSNGNVKVTYTGYTDFKRKSFTCKKIEYNNENGRVSSMTFDEIKQDETTY